MARLFFLGSGVYGAFLLSRAEPKLRGLILRTLGAAAAYVLFHTLILTRHLVVYDPVPFYYGAIFSFFFAMLWGGLLTVRSGRFAGLVNRAALVGLLVLFAWNFKVTNEEERDRHAPLYLTMFREQTKGMRTSGTLTFSQAVKAWRSRRDPVALEAMRSEFPATAYWLFLELSYFAPSKAR